MPSKRSSGESEWTLGKQAHFEVILKMHLSITNAVLHKSPFFNQTYQYIDATAGKGRYKRDGEELIGSPLIFLREADALGLNYEAHFIENDPSRYKKLLGNLPQATAGTFATYANDNSIAVPQILGAHDEKQLGLFYIDPSTGRPNFDLVALVSEKRPRMEVLLYLSATNLKREVSDGMLSDSIARVGKTNWMVRMPLKGDPHQWTFVLGSNTDIFRDYKRIGFYRLNSEEARQFFPKLNLTRQAYQNSRQPKLFENYDLDKGE